MTSTRLPGKVLLPIEGKPMILQQIERLQRCQTLEQIVVATSVDPSDDPLVEVLTEAGIECVRGPLDDVLARFVLVLKQYKADVVVRLTGDCPLACPEIVDQVVDAFHASSADYLSNTLLPTYPDGLDVEVLTSQTLFEIGDLSADPDEHEHVTLGIYRRPDRFRVANFVDPEGSDRSRLRWTVDNEGDFAFVSKIYSHFLPAKPNFDYADIVHFLETNPHLSRTDSDSARNAALTGKDTGVMKHPGNESSGE
jgi:spore coat polysaccharide biosynthesis protein SpsF